MKKWFLLFIVLLLTYGHEVILALPKTEAPLYLNHYVCSDEPYGGDDYSVAPKNMEELAKQRPGLGERFKDVDYIFTAEDFEAFPIWYTRLPAYGNQLPLYTIHDVTYESDVAFITLQRNGVATVTFTEDTQHCYNEFIYRLDPMINTVELKFME